MVRARDPSGPATPTKQALPERLRVELRPVLKRRHQRSSYSPFQGVECNSKEPIQVGYPSM